MLLSFRKSEGKSPAPSENRRRLSVTFQHQAPVEFHLANLWLRRPAHQEMVYAKRRPLGGFRRLLALTGGRHARSMTINHLPAKPALKADEASQHPCQDEICDICRSITLSAERSEERSVGKECVSTCRSRWSASH